jgi:hypothetical protein
VILIATVLYAGVRWLVDGPARALCRAALVASAAGIAVSIVGADLLRLVLVAQLQPWRVLWVASVIALVVAPLIAVCLWRGGTLMRIALVALLAAFLLADERFALYAALLAALLVAIAQPMKAKEPRELRLVLGGMLILLAAAISINLASGSIVARARYDVTAVPDWLRALRSICATGFLPALALVGLGFVVARARPAWLAATASACVAAAVVFALAVLPQWTSSIYSAANHAQFAAWRARIPPDAEVLWFENPVAAWVLLERRSYASNQQAATALFSREAAMLLRDRLASLHPFLEQYEAVAWRPRIPEEQRRMPTLSAVCGATPVRFVVTRHELEVAPLATAAATLPPALRDWKLYTCAGNARAQAAP